MRLIKHFLTKNECYIVNKNKKHIPKGGLLHSTGVDNPLLSRYIAPDDGMLGKASSLHWNQVLSGGKKACVHAFIGKLKNGSVATYQTLPWDMPCWGSGSGSLGFAKNANNNGYLQVEICEDGLNDKGYFDLVYKEAIELFAYWSKQFNWNPLTDIMCHSEGHKKGIASNHADVMHWFPKHGKSMDIFRYDVKKELDKLNSNINLNTLYRVQVGAFSNFNNAKKLVCDLKSKGYSPIIKEDKQEIIDMSVIAKQIEKELRKKLGQEYEKKFNDYKDNLSNYIKESEW